MRTAQYRELRSISWTTKVCLGFEELCSPILENLPFFTGSIFRVLFLKVFGKSCGKEVFIANRVSLRHAYNLSIGSYVGINQDTLIQARGGVTIGNNVYIGQRALINTGTHQFSDRDLLIREQATVYLPIKIGNDVFIGMGAMILPGVEVAEGCVISAGAVVTKNTEAYSVYAGIPAKKIKERGTSDQSSPLRESPPQAVATFPKFKRAVKILACLFVLLIGFAMVYSKPRPPFKIATQETKIQISPGVEMDMIWIPAGSYSMGTEAGNPDEAPSHQVTFSKGFWIGKYEVTQKQWMAVQKENPSEFKNPQHPVDSVNWEDCQQWITGLNQKVSGGGFRLPTEAEWEYACRAGTSTRYPFGADDLKMKKYAWYRDNSWDHFNGWLNRNLRVNALIYSKGYDRLISTWGTSDVGLKPPNAWGLHDCSGNVWEWCQDWYAGDYYKQSPVTDPQGPASGELKVMRGGSWFSISLDCRSHMRSRYPPKDRVNVCGFRVVKVDDAK